MDNLTIPLCTLTVEYLNIIRFLSHLKDKY